ncbi:hypothetical protein BDV06DRAFT_232185 [Aspergillus oleicola]
MPQVDGPAATRKMKKLERKKKNRRARKESLGEDDGEEEIQGKGKKNNDEEKGQTDHAEYSSDESVWHVHVNRGVPTSEFEHLEDAEHEQQQNEEHNQRDRNEESLVCQIHNRLLCLFKSTCCVHKAPVDCGCPPLRSCCCIHHAGDCCDCQPKPQTDEESKTLSLGSRPATPPTDTAASAAPATVSTAASATSPANPSGVKLTVTPASPSPFKQAKPVVIGGAEDANILALQASLELSDTMINMMDRNHMSDIRLILYSKNEQFWPIILTAHKCILARSPLVTYLLNNPYYSQEIQALAGENFFLIKPWELVVHYLYGKPALTPETLKPVTLESLGYDACPHPACEPEYQFSLPSAMLDMALGYAVCAAFFYLPTLTDTGFRLALDLLSWETVEQVLHFGLCTEKFAVILPGPPWIESGRRELSQPSQSQYAKEQGKVTKQAAEVDIAPTGGDSSKAKSGFKAPAAAGHPFPIPELQSDWSRRLVAAALHFIVDHIKPDFELYCGVQQSTVPDRIPDLLKTVADPPPLAATPVTTIVEEKDTTDEAPTATVPTPPHPSAAVANNPRLAEVKFGSFLKANEEVERQTQATAASNSSSQTPPRLHHHTQTQAQTPTTPTPMSKNSKAPEGPLVVSSSSLNTSPAPGPEITIPSAILLRLPFHELKMAFGMLSTRGVMSAAFAKAVVLERESRRRAALRNYAKIILEDVIKEKTKEKMIEKREEKEKEQGGAEGVVAASPGSGSGRKKGKARKAAKEEKKKAKEKEKAEKEKEIEKEKEQEKEKKQDKGITKTKSDSASISGPTSAPVVVHTPEAVRELCYREFFSSKVYGNPQQDLGHGHGGAQGPTETEIVLEREWVGIDYLPFISG